MVTKRGQSSDMGADAGSGSGSRRLYVRGFMGVVLTAVVVVAGLLIHSAWPMRQATGDGGASEVVEKRVPVVLTAAKTMDFELSVKVSGTVEAKNCALVSARMPGSLDAVHVDEGDIVEAGVTALFQSDSMNVTRAVAIAEQGLHVAEMAVREKEASLEQMIADRELAQMDLERYRNLIQDNAISRQLYDQQETREKQACAMVKHAKAQLDLEKAKLEQARLALLMAEKDLADSKVVAPISGRVSQRYKEPGEMAGAGTPVLKIEDLSVLEISVFLPEEHFAMVRPGRTPMRVRVSGVDLGVLMVGYKSPTVNRKLRTFEVKGLIESPPEGSAPGCLAEVVVVLDQRQGVGVPSAAIQQRGGSDVLFLVEDGHARMLPVEAGRSSAGWTEIRGEVVSAGTEVVTMGQQLVTDGAAVSIVEKRSP